MNDIDIINIVILLFGGILSALMGFDVIRLDEKKISDKENLILRKQKIRKLLKVNALICIAIACFLLILPKFVDEPTWSQVQKRKMKEQIINSSVFLQSINSDTAGLVASCIVDKYTKRYTIQESWKQDKMNKKQAIKKFTPIISECFKLYGYKRIDNKDSLLPFYNW